MYCFNCGNKIEDNFAYCPWCGTRMQGKAPAVGSGGGTHRTGESGGKTAGSPASDFVISGGTLEKYIGESQKVRIPTNVRAIGRDAFKATMVVSVHIPDGVIKIGESAFDGCSMLTYVNLPDAVTEIGESAFSGCSMLADINIPNTVTEIGWGAFRGCSSLKSLSIPCGMSAVSIESFAFSGCTSLTEVCIDADISKLDFGAFRDCGALRRVTLGGNVENFGSHFFEGCTSLTELVISGSCKEVDGFSDIRSLVSVSLPQGLETIGECAFRGCESLKNINIPESVTCIKEEAFKGCTSLVSINIPNRNISIGQEAFFGCTSLRSFNCANAALIDGYRFKNTPVGEANGICSYCGHKIGIFGKCTECKKPRKYT